MKGMLGEIPKEFIEAARLGQPVPLDPDKTRVFFYKKDDWKDYGVPISYSCGDDLMLLSKLKLADKAALDGAVSKVRVWAVGDVQNGLIPTPALANALANILQNNVGGGVTDIIWDEAIKLIESDTNLHQFLGKEKYEPTLMSIYATLGIPPTLTGTFGTEGTTNNFMSLKTLVERLEYGRSVLTEFWNEQIAIVTKAMGFKRPAIVEYDHMNLSDDAARHALLIQLADRNIISEEFIHDTVNANTEIERSRLAREEEMRDGGELPVRSSPYHNPDLEADLKKIALQSGGYAPSELGLELEPKKSGEKSPNQLQPKPPAGPSGGPKKTPNRGKQGRPKNSKDSGPRKSKTFKPKSKAATYLWANKAVKSIATLLNPGLLSQFNKDNMRQLTQEEAYHAERVKFGVLFNLEPDSEIDMATLATTLERPADISSYSTYVQEMQALAEELDRKLTAEERLHLQINLYVEGIHNGED